MFPWFYIIWNGPPLTQLLDYVSGNAPIYIGEAIPGSTTSGAVWRIKKLTYDVNGNVTSIQWSPLAGSFGDIWNNRASLTYS